MNKLFYCDKCERNYNSYQSIWNHNKKFHTSDNIKTHQPDNITPQNYTCEYCYKQYNNKYNKY